MYIFVIYSHLKNLENSQLIYEEIVKKINLEVIIIYGDPLLNEEYIKKNHILTLKCGDSYDDLTDKTFKMLEVCNILYPELIGLFKCDDDIILNVNRFNVFLRRLINFQHYDYVGVVTFTYNEKGTKEYNTLHAQYCGGPLYYLSKKSINTLLENPITKGYYEDNCIGYNLNKNNIFPLNFPIYSNNYNKFIKDKNVLSFHNNYNIKI